MKNESEPSSQPEKKGIIDGEIVETSERKNTQPVKASGPVSFDIQSLLSQAISQGNVEIAERVLAMHDKLKAAWAKEQFDKAMSKFQGECPVIEKTKKVFDNNGKLRYKFAPLDSIVAQTKKAIAKNGLSYTIKTTNGEKSLTSTVRVTHIAGHSEDNSFEVPIGEEQYMSQVQKYGARSTFAKRYAYCDAFGIMTGDEDNDAVEKEEKPKPSPKPAQQAAPKQQPQPPKNTALIKVKKKLHDLGAGTEAEAVELLQEMTGIKWKDLKATEKMAELALEALKKKEESDKDKEFKKEPKEGDICNVDGKIGTLVMGKDGKLFCLVEDVMEDKSIKNEVDTTVTEKNEQKEKWPFPPAKINVLLGLIKSKKGIKTDKEAVRYINTCIKHPAFPDRVINAMEDLNMDEGDRLIKFMMISFPDNQE